MKTNHRRGYKDAGSFRDPPMSTLTKRLTDRVAAAARIGNDFTDGHRGASRAKSGAKAYLRHQERLDGKRQCKEEPQ